jgi:hypothetical protein
MPAEPKKWQRNVKNGSAFSLISYKSLPKADLYVAAIDKVEAHRQTLSRLRLTVTAATACLDSHGSHQDPEASRRCS